MKFPTYTTIEVKGIIALSYRLNICPHPQFIILNSNIGCDGVRRLVLWEMLRSWDWISTLIKGTPQCPRGLFAVMFQWEKCRQWGRVFSPDTESAGTRILEFLTSRTMRNKGLLLIKHLGNSILTFLVAQTVKNLPQMQETWVHSLGQEDPLEESMVIHSTILAWRIPWKEEPGGLQSMASQRVRHHWATFIHM